MDLDHETTPQYNLTITASDPDGLTAMQIVTLDILDVNEAPAIQNLPRVSSIYESVTGKIQIFNIDVKDQDGDPIAFKISSWPPSSLFEIDSTGKNMICILLCHCCL